MDFYVNMPETGEARLNQFVEGVETIYYVSYYTHNISEGLTTLKCTLDIRRVQLTNLGYM